MEIDLKLAVYLDEAGTEPGSACDTLTALKLPYVTLRYGWGDRNICSTAERGLDQLRSLLTQHNLSVVAIGSDLGDVPVQELNRITPAAIRHTLSLVTYFNATHVRIYCGNIGTGTLADVDAWMGKITEQCISSNCIPLMEITQNSFLTQPTDIAAMLHKHKRWKLLYDPA